MVKNKKLEKYDLEIQLWLESPPETLSQLKKFHDSMIIIHLGGVGLRTVLSKKRDLEIRTRVYANYKVNHPKS